MVQHKLIDMTRAAKHVVSVDDAPRSDGKAEQKTVTKPSIEDVSDLMQVPMDESLGWKSTYIALFDCLLERSIDVVESVMRGQGIREIGKVYRLDGHRLWHNVHNHARRCLGTMTQAGDLNAAALRFRFCNGRA